MGMPFTSVLRIVASYKGNPLIVSPVDLCNILVKVKNDMRTNPQQELPDYLDTNIWAYFFIMKVTLHGHGCFSVGNLTIPLISWFYNGPV